MNKFKNIESFEQNDKMISKHLDSFGSLKLSVCYIDTRWLKVVSFHVSIGVNEQLKNFGSPFGFRTRLMLSRHDFLDTLHCRINPLQ